MTDKSKTTNPLRANDKTDVTDMNVARKSLTTRDRRNLDPSAEAIAAMYLYGSEYAAQGGGSMDFWDALDASRKRICTELVTRIKTSHREAQ